MHVLVHYWYCLQRRESRNYLEWQPNNGAHETGRILLGTHSLSLFPCIWCFECERVKYELAGGGKEYGKMTGGKQEVIDGVVLCRLKVGLKKKVYHSFLLCSFLTFKRVCHQWFFLVMYILKLWLCDYHNPSPRECPLSLFWAMGEIILATLS